MHRWNLLLLAAALGIASACNRVPTSAAAAARAAALVADEAPPPLRVQKTGNGDTFTVANPGRFPLATATERSARSQLHVTGTIVPDVARTVPVVSLATGRVIEVDARLGDTVRKGQILLRLQSADIADAAAAYHNAVSDDQLARTQLARAQDLYAHGATALGDLQIAQNAAAKTATAVTDASERLHVLGVGDLRQVSEIVAVRAPIAGVITDQQVTTAAGVQGLSSPNPFTISDLSTVWVLCDVYEDDLRQVALGDRAEIHLDAYPGRVIEGTVSNVGAILDPALRTAKVRIEVRNPGVLRPGMFVTATLIGRQAQPVIAVPATAILHLHDRDWVFEPAGGNSFRRVGVVGGGVLPGGMQAVASGLAVGQPVVINALQFSGAVAQQ